MRMPSTDRREKQGSGSRALEAVLFCLIVAIASMLLVQTPACAQQVSLTWDASVSSNVAGYKIHYGTVNGNYSWVVDAGNNTSCTISGLSTGATYYFAATAYDSAGDQSAYSNQVSYNRALALEKMKDWQGLLEWRLKWTKSEPENAGSWYELGGAYGYLNRYNDAVEAYRQAIKINPEYTDAWHNLGVAYYKLTHHRLKAGGFKRPNDLIA